MTEERGVLPPSQEEITRLGSVAEEVRRASREARLLPLGPAAEAFSPSEPDRLTVLLSPDAWPADQAEARPADLRTVSEAGRSWLYSDTFMTSQYAATAARIEAGDRLNLIAETARFDSETYPRPTPVSAFTQEPYELSEEEVAEALASIGADPRYPDIRTVRSSNGALYVYSSAHLVPDLAEALAEWDAVGQYDSP